MPPEVPTVSITLFSPQVLGGRLRLFTHKWDQLTSDAWVLQTVSGFHIEFWGTPVQEVLSRPLVFSEADTTLIDSEVQDLLRKEAVRASVRHLRGFVSNLFLVEKKDKGFWPVINLRAFNEWVIYRHFKMECIHMLRDFVLHGDWLIRLDLKDTYLTVPIFPPHRRFLQFIWRDQVFNFTSLPFGLSSAPWSFTKMLKPVVEYLRSRGIRLIIYLDDGPVSRTPSVQCKHNYSAPPIPGVCDKRPEVGPSSISVHDLPGFPHRLPGGHPQSPGLEDSQNQEGVVEGLEGQQNLTPAIGQSSGAPLFLDTGHLSGPASLQGPSTP
ncbi:hypothetical protein NDU88_009959 [Pleurodeles waltl]|uniref:Reverse transcriptase domain-containing protein n=1 Tax=Pleurodeles waltl TaxID=8319 RepID=A0AAV7QT17_PLEWA|nr:hypothetical protein NDU88_009959 [Pleurodeles waltl]